VRERNFAVLDLGTPITSTVRRPAVSVLAPGATVEKLADGFHSIAGAAVDSSGTLYLVDHHQHRIYAWSQTTGLSVVRDAPLDAVNLAFDRSGTLLVLSSAGPAGTVYTFSPGGPADTLEVLQPQPRRSTPGGTFAIPASFWVDGQFRNHLDPGSYEYETHAQMFTAEVSTAVPNTYATSDGSLQLPAGRVFAQGPDGSYPGMDDSGWRWSHALDAFSLITAMPGEHVYVTSGAENRTYRAVVQDDGTLSSLERFVERGGESAVADGSGHVYLANGQVFVYGCTGELIGQIDVPERPTGLRIGGPNHKTLFILTHHALYAVRLRHRG
jgi:sugar lactone lactonase YvrE